MTRFQRTLALTSLAAVLSLPGCTTCRTHWFSRCSDDCNNGCNNSCNNGCQQDCESGSCGRRWCGLGWWGGGCSTRLCGATLGCCYRRSNAIPQTLPLGSTVQSHYQVMETNGEAMDFIINQHEFMGETAQLTPEGKDTSTEIAAWMRRQ